MLDKTPHTLLIVSALAMAMGACAQSNAPMSHGGAMARAASVSPATTNPMVGGAAMYESRNIIENAVNSKDHTTLVAAVQAAGLVETLQGPGPFTVFAPVNAAFDALPPGTVDTLLRPENKAQLTKVLTCHVVAASALSGAINQMIMDDRGAHPVTTVGGCVLTARMASGRLALEDETGGVAYVTIADVRQSNGVIHVIDRVLLPAPEQPATMNPMVGGAAMYESRNIIENAVNSKDHTTLVAAVQAAGLVETLQGPGPFTVFAPVNAAFDALPPGTVDTLLRPENKAQLTKVLACHVVAANALSGAINQMIMDDRGAHPVTTVGGCTLMARRVGDRIALTDETGGVAYVTIADVRQSNGVIHVIDRVLLPAG